MAYKLRHVGRDILAGLIPATTDLLSTLAQEPDKTKLREHEWGIITRDTVKRRKRCQRSKLERPGLGLELD